MELGSKSELGEFYRELRQARGIKQKEVAKGILTPSQLSKFENGNSMLSADKMLVAIDGINMTFSEFGYALNHYSSSKHQQLSDKIVAFFNDKDIEGLKKLLEEHSPITSPYDRLNSLLIKNTIHSLDPSYMISVEDKEFLTQYLYSIESWTAYELHLFGNTMPLMSDADLLFLGKELVKRSKIYYALPNFKQALKYTYLNYISELILRLQYDYIDLFIRELNNLLSLMDSSEKILLKFMELLRKCFFEHSIQRLDLEEYIERVDLLGLSDLASLLQMRLIQHEKIILERSKDD